MRPRHRAVALAAAAVLGASGWMAYDKLDAYGRTTECFLSYDTADDRQVAFAAADVFEGRVLDHDGPELLDTLPVDTYEVAVGARHKGDLRGTVTVIHTRNGSDRLKPGSSYVFATRRWREGDGVFDAAGHWILAGTTPAPAGRGAVAAHWRGAVAHAVDPEAMRRPARAGR
ncbi:hypothetical protein ACIO3O_39485 [Streptomyces sp. NPDC087440]|uniref:hypothetical protein n=1 Tax=Streptomyces sp. NPDC087440 TaxID=3365790 RepID=UPI0037F76329